MDRLHLPAQMTQIIGRSHEITAGVALLGRGDVRMVTLSGPGGVGKTRLSIEIARRLSETFADGVFFVSLAPLRESEQVILAIAQAIGLETGTPSLWSRLQAYLHDKQLLLLMDNFEHICTAAPLLADLLSSAPLLKVLVTSREVLHLYGEHE